MIMSAILASSVALASGSNNIEFKECAKCSYRLRLSPDATHATINLAKVTSDAERSALVKRAETLMGAFAKSQPQPSASTSSRRPLMGWSSWNTFGVNISEDIILSIARAMATNGLKAAGYTYVNIDDGFFNGHDENGNLRFNLKRFPNGMKPVVDGIHALGLKAGTYSDAGINTCGSLYSADPMGAGSGLYGHDEADCRLHFNELGFDFIKVDYCGAREQKLDERTRYTEIAKAIRATGKDVHFNVCRWAYPGTWITDIADSWRTTGDIRANWRSVRGIIRENLYLSSYVSPGHYNDMDMLEIGQLRGRTKTFFGKKDEGLTQEEEATHFGMWCMLSSPLMIGCDVRTIPESSRDLVTNRCVLAMSQNELGLAGYVVQREGEAYVLVKDADRRFGTARFVALCNLKDKPHDFSVNFATLDLGGKVAAFDLVERGDIGECEGHFDMTVPAHATRFLRLDAERRLERSVYDAETAYLTDYQELHSGEKVGTAFPREMAGAHNGVAVGCLGKRESNDLVWRDVRIDAEAGKASAGGAVTLAFSVASPDERSFDVQIDGGEKTRLTVGNTGGKFVTVSMSWEPTARSGAVATEPSGAVATEPSGAVATGHTIRLSNATAWMPDIDCMIIKH